MQKDASANATWLLCFFAVPAFVFLICVICVICG